MNSFYLYNKYYVGPIVSLYDYHISLIGELLPKYPKPRASSSSNAYHFQKIHGIR